MAFDCGFYNAVEHDRTYSALQFGEMFDGLIQDGIYATIGDAFSVKPGGGMSVIVGSGRCWFNRTWSVNTDDYPLEIEPSDLLLPRIDSVILEVDKRVSGRMNSIKVLTGTPSTNPSPTVLIRDPGQDLYQYRLATIEVKENVEEIEKADITNYMGRAETPFVTGILQSISIDAAFLQWEGQFEDWFKEIKSQLSGDVAANIQNQVNELKNGKVNVSDEASLEQIRNGENGKWVDADNLRRYTDERLTPETGAYTIQKTKYPMRGQFLKTSDHHSLFSKIGYTAGHALNMSPGSVVSVGHLSDSLTSEKQWFHSGFRSWGFPYGDDGRVIPKKTNVSGSTVIHTQENLTTKSGEVFSGGAVLLGESEKAIVIAGKVTNTTPAIYKFVVYYKADNGTGAVTATSEATFSFSNFDTFIPTLSPCVKDGLFKWPLLYTSNDQLFLQVFTVTNFESASVNGPGIAQQNLQVPLPSNGGPWSANNLSIGIARSIVLNGIVYIHMINTSGVFSMIGYNLFSGQFFSISSDVQKTIGDWSEKYYPFDYTRTAYNSFTTESVGAIKYNPDGSEVSVGILYLENGAVKKYEDTTYIAESNLKDVRRWTPTKTDSIFGDSMVSSAYPASIWASYVVKTENEFDIQFQFSGKEPYLIVYPRGDAPLGCSFGIFRIKIGQPLSPLQLYIFPTLDAIIGYQKIDQMYQSRSPVSIKFKRSYNPSSRSIKSTSARFGIATLTPLSVLELITYSVGSTSVSPVTSSSRFWLINLNFPLKTGEFRLLNAGNAPLYYGA